MRVTSNECLAGVKVSSRFPYCSIRSVSKASVRALCDGKCYLFLLLTKYSLTRKDVIVVLIQVLLPIVHNIYRVKFYLENLRFHLN